MKKLDQELQKEEEIAEYMRNHSVKLKEYSKCG
jgi:hypothetical protein